MANLTHLPNPPDGSNQTFELKADLLYPKISGWGTVTISTAGITAVPNELMSKSAKAPTLTHANPTIKTETLQRVLTRPQWLLIEAADGEAFL